MAGSVLPNPWDEALALAWEAFCARTTPIGAVVLDGTGHLVARARCRRADSGPVPGQLSDTRIAHAEVNVLAQLPFGRDYADHELYATVEPCCLCMGAAIQTGVGAVHYAWADAYAGAASCLTVDNPQVRRKALSVHEPPGGTVSWLAGLLVAVHYEIDVSRRLDHVTRPWKAVEPELFAQAADVGVQDQLRVARRERWPVTALIEHLGATPIP
jgi:tRNA(Arg) A34 adenosine deaminase TadA